MLNIVFETANKIKNDRDHYQVLASLVEEVGELGQEIRVAKGHTYKSKGKDGIIGEAVDVIAVALDMIYLENPLITEEEVNKLLQTKCNKWYDKIPDNQKI